VVVLEEPNSRNWLTIKVERIKPFNTATLTALNSNLNDGHYKVEEVLKECTTGAGRHEYKVKWVGYTNHRNSWVAEEDLHANCLLEQFQASRSSATTDRVRNPKGPLPLSEYHQLTLYGVLLWRPLGHCYKYMWTPLWYIEYKSPYVHGDIVSSRTNTVS